MGLSGGSTFAGYTIVRLLGAGGMGEVYLAQHPRLPRQDALKILTEQLSGDSAYRDRFLREADLAAKLWHPNIVRVNDRGEDQGQLWIAMDYIDGTDAGELLRRYPAGAPAADVAAIVTAVGNALDYAHRQGLLHRDVKPANILITAPDAEFQRRILLGDFGIARSVDDISGLTQTNMTVGTVAYAAPEQLMGEQIDGRADQYALAATAYHLLTGAQLFPNTNAAVVISRHLNAAPPSVSVLRPELAALDPVIAKALSKDPADRYPRCADFARDFAAATGNLTAVSPQASTALAPTPARPAASTPPPPTPAPVPAAKPRPRWPVIAGSIVMGVVALIGIGAAYAVMSDRSDNTAAPSITQTTTTPTTPGTTTTATTAPTSQAPQSPGSWATVPSTAHDTSTHPSGPYPDEATMATYDDEFLTQLPLHGIGISNHADVLKTARQVCNRLRAGEDLDQVSQGLSTATGTELATSQRFATLVANTYPGCERQ